MHENLRRRALESGKTTSNKAKSKPTSRASSRANSRLQSRDVSDDEDMGGNLSDDTNHSIASIDEVLDNDEYTDLPKDATRQELSKTIDNLLERKGSSINSREEALASFDRCLTAHYLPDSLTGRTSDILSALTKTLKPGATEKEATLAVRAISLIAVTVQDDHFYDHVSPILRRIISDSEYPLVKAAAITALAACMTFGGIDEVEIDETLTYLLEVVSSDGDFIDAGGNADVLTAALTSYGFLATFVDNLEQESEDAVDAFLDQLDADDVRVQIAAGENIALLYEKSWRPRVHRDISSGEDDDDEEDLPDDFIIQPDPVPLTKYQASLVKGYDAFHNKTKVLDKVRAVASHSTKHMSRKDRRQLHQAFNPIIPFIESPKLGLRGFGASKLIVRIHKEGQMKVDSWWKLLRLNGMRRVLAGGYVNHYLEGNEQLLDVAPMIMTDENEETEAPPTPSKNPNLKSAKGRYRGARRFIGDGSEEPGL